MRQNKENEPCVVYIVRSGQASQTEEGGGRSNQAQVILSPEISLNSSPDRQTTFQLDSTLLESRRPQRVYNYQTTEYQKSVVSQTQRPFQRAEISTRPKELEEGFKNGLQINRLQVESASVDDDYYNYRPTTSSRGVNQRAEHSRGRKPTERSFVVLVDEDRRRQEIARAPEITTGRTSFESVSEPTARRQTARTTEQTRSPFRFVVNPRDPEQQITLIKTEEPRTAKKIEPVTQYTPRFPSRQEQTSPRSRYRSPTELISRFQIDSQNINELASDIYDSTTEYVLRYPSEDTVRNIERSSLRSKPESTTEYISRYLTRGRSTPKKYESNTEYTPRYLSQRKQTETVKSTKKVENDFLSATVDRQAERVKSTKKYEPTIEFNSRYLSNNRELQTETAINYENEYVLKYLSPRQDSKDTQSGNEPTSENIQRFVARDSESEVTRKKYDNDRPTTEYVPKYLLQDRSTETRNLQNIQSKTIDSYTLNRPSYLKPKLELTPILNNSLSQTECNDCTEKPLVRYELLFLYFFLSSLSFSLSFLCNL